MALERIASFSSLVDGKPEARVSACGELIVLRLRDRVQVYVNRCPHKGASLDWSPGKFLSPDGQYLQCATHAALFRFEDGECVAGPCAGDALMALAVVRQGDDICIEV
jgi:nitrite reductase/ring-hydroxylating ferredoxin subunit